MARKELRDAALTNSSPITVDSQIQPESTDSASKSSKRSTQKELIDLTLNTYTLMKQTSEKDAEYKKEKIVRGIFVCAVYFFILKMMVRSKIFVSIINRFYE